MELIPIEENGIYVVFGINQYQEIKLLHFSSKPLQQSDFAEPDLIHEAFQLVQVNLSGYDRPYERHGNKYVVTTPGYLLKYVDLQDTMNEHGRLLTITQEDSEITGTRVVTTMQFYTGTQVVRFKNKVTNIGKESQTLEYLSSFCYYGIEKEGTASSDDKMFLSFANNGWQKELSWRTQSFQELGMAQTQPTLFQRTSKTIEVYNTGNWSTKQYLPMGYLENRDAGTSLYWQIEHNGSWQYEIGDMHGQFYLCVSGPTEIQSHWWKILEPGDSFESVPVAVGVGQDDFSEDMGELTKYRRKIRRNNADNENLPVIFNDYMNCLFGDPTTEKELPLIDAAAKAGCEYFVIDAGWYSAGEWWDNVGEWKESRERFPNGVKEVTDYIRSLGMIPGVWLELEVMGIHCDLVKKVPDDWFFLRHGKRVYDRSRYQLDFRNPEVIAHVTEVIDRVVRDYGVGYIKMDYNIEPGIGTELHADSVGDGMLGHERAYLAWLDGIFQKYPELVIENCSSGGLRMDYAMLSRYSIQSTSDQEDYRNYATIAANAVTGVTPEQAAVWSYPLREGDREEVIFNMVNAMLLRIHQSGHLAELTRERLDLVTEGIAYYKKIRQDIKCALPFWPTGLADNRDLWACAGLKTDHRAYLAVWKRGGKEKERFIPLAKFLIKNKDEKQEQLKRIKVIQAYPEKEPCKYEYVASEGALLVNFEQDTMARIFEVIF